MKKIVICTNRRSNPAQPSCGARGGEEIADRLQQLIAAQGLAIQVECFPCLGRCDQGPNARLAPGGKFFSHLEADHLDAVMAEIRAFIAD